jgi:uncharacterized protein (DUF2147 family)
MRLVSAIFLFLPLAGLGQSISGKWKTIDDSSGKEKSIVEIFEKEGKFYGRVVRIFVEKDEDPDPVCDKCPEDDARYKKKIIGMEIIRGLSKSGDRFEDGDILDPEVGKIYKCRLWLEGKDLKVRGFWGPFYRTQTWKRV